MSRVLISGFDAFGGLDTNPSAKLAAMLANGLDAASVEMLPTSYGRATKIMIGALERSNPEYCLMFG